MKFDEIASFLMNSWLKWNFDDISTNFQGIYCFKGMYFEYHFKPTLDQQARNAVDSIWARSNYIVLN